MKLLQKFQTLAEPIHEERGPVSLNQKSTIFEVELIIQLYQ
jgi:hypothetical protein